MIFASSKAVHFVCFFAGDVVEFDGNDLFVDGDRGGTCSPALSFGIFDIEVRTLRFLMQLYLSGVGNSGCFDANGRFVSYFDGLNREDKAPI